MNYPQLWRTSGIAFSLLSAVLAAPSTQAAGHTVRSGDTFTSIAKKYKISVSTLQKANPRLKPGVILSGQVIDLPGSAAPKPAAVVVPKSAKPVDVKPKQAPSAKSPKAASAPEESRRLSSVKPSKPSKPAKRATGSAITTYRVRSGDTATTIAKRSGISVGELADMNGLDRLDLQEGQKLVLPAGTAVPSLSTEDRENTVDLTPPARRSASGEDPARRSAPPVNPPASSGTYYHVVKRGETFSSIAKDRKVSLAALTKANQSVNPARLNVGQQLNVPGLQVASNEVRGSLIDESLPARPSTYRFDDGAGPAALDGTDNQAPSIAYRITARDTPETLAREFNTTPGELRHLNHMGTFDQFTPGSFIQVPWQNPARPD